MPSIRGKLWWHAFRASARFRRPLPAARLFFGALERVSHSRGGEGIRVLVLSKEGLSEDVDSCLGSDPRFDIFRLDVVRNKALKAMASAFLPPDIDDSCYLSGKPEAAEGKRRYRAFLESFWPHLQRRLRADAVLSANFAYYAERELAAVLEQSGTPFVVLHKENLKSPGRVEFFERVYRERRGPFHGRRILVYNEIERGLQVAAGVVTPDRVTVTGMPRLDRMHRWRRRTGAAAGKKSFDVPQVLFFSFDAKTGLPKLARKPGAGVEGGHEPLGEGMDDLSWSRLVRESHDAVVRFARERPDVRVVVKAKRNLPAQSPVGEIPKEPSPNLEVAVGGDPFDLIVRSNVVVGFNTTALFEALAAGIPVVVPWFAEALDVRMQPYVVNMESSVSYARSPGELAALLSRFVEEAPRFPRELDPEASGLLDRWVGNADGLAGRRVREALLAEVGRRDGNR